MKMKIAYLSCVYPPYPGGIGVAAAGMARIMRTRGHDVRVIVPVPRDLKLRSQEPFVRYLPARFQLGNAAWLPRLRAAVRDADVVHILYPFFGVAEPLLFGPKQHPKVLLHHIMDPVATGLKGLIFKLHQKMVLPKLLQRSDMVADMSQDFFDGSDFGPLYKKNHQLPKVSFIPLGVDTTRFTPAESSPKIPTIIFTAGMDQAHYFKGVPILLKALHELKRRGVAYHCLLIGEGELRAKFEAEATQLGLSDHVTFTGLVPNDDLPRFYREANVFVMPSTARVESFSISTAEAQSSGLPTIVSDFPGVRATIEEGVTGYSVPPGDHLVLADKLEYLLRNPDIAKQMGAAGRARAIAYYDWKVIGQQLEKCYQEVLR